MTLAHQRSAKNPSAMVAEAAQAAQVLRRQGQWWAVNSTGFHTKLSAFNPLQIVTCARGSSDHAATYAKYLIESILHLPVMSFSPSTSSIYDVPMQGMERTLFLAISQSGQSSDLVISAQAAKKAGAIICAIVNDEASPLAEVADIVIPQLAGRETSVAATKTYIASLFAIFQIVAHLSQDTRLHDAASGFPDVLQRDWASDWGRGAEKLRNVRNMFVIGRGPTYGIAQEAALKMKETCGIHAESFSAAEVRHGPMELVNSGFPVLMFTPGDNAALGFSDLAAEFARRGANVIVAGADYPETAILSGAYDLHPALSPICMIQSFYQMAARISALRGLNPDQPVHLSKVTDTR